MDTQDKAFSERKTMPTTWDWPFNPSELLAGLRRYYGDPSLQIQGIQPVTFTHLRAAVGRVRGLEVSFQGKGSRGEAQFVVKEPRGTTRTGLAGAGRREVGVYQHLSRILPLQTPALIAGSEAGDWMILELVIPAREPDEWVEADYICSMDGLADLHDHFWNLGEDLSAFPWLGRPLDADFEIHVAAAAKALERIVESGQPKTLAGDPVMMEILARIILQAEEIAAPLLEEPQTLLHGDYWPGNITINHAGDQVVYDWQMASVGPGILDLIVFYTKDLWWFGIPIIPHDDIIQRYRRELAHRTGHTWKETRWEQLWDHALMWRFMQEWMDLLAAMPNILIQSSVDQLKGIWLDPIRRSVSRRLGA